MIREKELRLALVCYGGVSLAVYMHGVTKELWKLLRASEARKSGRALEGDTELVWRALLEEMAETVDLVVICDILAGASAGGLNAILLSNALTLGQTLEPLTEMWLQEADVENLLDPEARPKSGLIGRLGRIYKEPIAWLAGRKSSGLESVDVPEARAEVTLKLAHFVRSRWFRPPFSGAGLTALIDNAMDAMETAPAEAPLVPPALSFSLFVTVTDYWGVKTDLSIHSPAVVTEVEHRRLFAFESPSQTRQAHTERIGSVPRRRPAAERPALLLAARATASFPGAFPPASIREVDRRLSEQGREWPGRAAFVDRYLASDRAPEEVLLIDGSVLNNAPFGPAIEAIHGRPAHRDVDRRFVYIDPKPGISGPGDLFDRRPPGFFTAIFRSLADIPREQPIRDSLEAISALSERSARLRAVTDAMAPDVDAAIEHAIGSRFFLRSMSEERLTKARSSIQSQAARDAGFAFGAYAQLKLQLLLDEAAALVANLLRLDAQETAVLRRGLVEAAAARGAFAHDAALGRAAAGSGYVRLLRELDISFRIRRLRFIIRRLTAESAASTNVAERESAEALKAALYRCVGPFEERRHQLPPEHRAEISDAANQLLSAVALEEQIAAGGQLLDQLASALTLSTLDAEADRALVAATENPAFARSMRRSLLRAWLGFPFYDIVILPLVRNESLEGFEELKVDRISPDDADALVSGGVRASLKGWQMNAFAAFFSRAYRENDYLWGRLHAAERLFDIVTSSVPERGFDGRRWKARLFRAILESEQDRLSHVPELIRDLTERIRIFEEGGDNPPREQPEKL